MKSTSTLLAENEIFLICLFDSLNFNFYVLAIRGVFKFSRSVNSSTTNVRYGW